MSSYEDIMKVLKKKDNDINSKYLFKLIDKIDVIIYIFRYLMKNIN